MSMRRARGVGFHTFSESESPLRPQASGSDMSRRDYITLFTVADLAFWGIFCSLASYVVHNLQTYREYLCQVQSMFIIPEKLTIRQYG